MIVGLYTPALLYIESRSGLRSGYDRYDGWGCEIGTAAS